MTVKTYIKKPIPTQAIQWKGDNLKAVLDFISGSDDIWRDRHGKYGKRFSYTHHELYVRDNGKELHAVRGDYIIKSMDGGYYPCPEHIFEKTYEEANK